MRIRHVRDKLILAILAVALPLLVLLIACRLAGPRASRYEALRPQRDAAVNASDVLVTYFHGLAATSLAVGDRFFTGGVFTRDLTSTVASINRSGRSISHLALINPGGTVTVSDSPRLLGLDLSGNKAVRAVRSGADWSAADAGAYPVDRSQVGVVTGVRSTGGRFYGSVLAVVDESDLRTALRPLPGRSERVVVTDSRGVVVMTSTGPRLTWRQRQWSNRPYIRRALSGKETYIDRVTMPDGAVMTGVIRPIAEIGWAVGVFRPSAEVLGPSARESARRVLLMVALTLLVLGVAVYLGNRLSRPIRRLVRSVRRFGEGRLDARADVRTGDELEYLAQRFNDMARTLQFRQAELREAADTRTRQHREAETLYRTAEEIIVTPSLHDKLEVVARSLCEITHVKRCVILLRQGNRIVGATGWGLSSPEVVESFDASLAELDPNLAKAVETLRPVMVPEEGEGRVLPETLRGFHVARMLVLPITHADRFVGLAVLDNPGELPTFTGQSVDAALRLTELAAVAVENARLYERETRISEELQQQLLPSVPREVGRLHLAAGYYPAPESAEVGGDFYDYIEMPDGRFGLTVADISGRGLEAAVYSTMGKYTMRAFLIEHPSPSNVLTMTNDALVKSSREWGFMTAFLGVIDPDTHTLTYAGAGHPPAIIVRADGETSCMPCLEQQPPLGILNDIAYVERSLALDPGDTLICYTDGLMQIRAHGELFDIDQISQLAARNRHMEPEDLADMIYASACESSDGRLFDDVAILIVKAR